MSLLWLNLSNGFEAQRLKFKVLTMIYKVPHGLGLCLLSDFIFHLSYIVLHCFVTGFPGVFLIHSAGYWHMLCCGGGGGLLCTL